MSPLRRRALLGAAAVALLAVLALVGVRGLRGDEGPAATAPAGPVLLVPGYGGGTEALEVLAAALEEQGRTAQVVPAPGDGTGDLREHARGLDAAARAAAAAAGAASVDVVAFSAGGVVARLWVEDLDGAALARRVVTLGSPHHGAELAGTALAGDGCPPACQQLAPGSAVLEGLPEPPGGPAWTSVWTADDAVVTPPESAQLAGAVDVELQAVCRDARTAHGELPTDPLAVGVVAVALADAPLAGAPAPEQCGDLRARGSALLAG